MKDKVVWISGASSGIGAACAEECAKKGARIILSARNETKLNQIKEGLATDAHIIPLDVSQADQISQAAQEAVSQFGQVDVLINNAGISQRGLVEETDIAVDRRLFEVNYFGNIGLTKAILPHMLERDSGNIVVISSLAGKMSTPGRSSYAATKHALHGFYDALRAELSDRNVHVNMICPGYIKTDISLNALDSKGKKHGVMDPGQAQGLSANKCAQGIIKAIQQNKREVSIGGKETNYLLIRKFFPSMYHRIIAKMAKEKRY